MKKRLRTKGIYWQQFYTSACLVALTLVLLGTSFFSLSYSYLWSEKKEELEEKARLMAIRAESAVEDVYDDLGLRAANPAQFYAALDEHLDELFQMAQEMSGIEFLIWIPGTAADSGILFGTDASTQGMAVSLPERMGEKLAKGEIYTGRTDLGLYDSPRLVVAIPPHATDGGTTLIGPTMAVAETRTMTGIWRGFLGIFGATAFTVLLVAFLLTASTTMQQTKPIKDMVEATRKFAQGNFDARVYHSGREDEIGELTDALNAMADSLQRNEQQRREFIANISHELKTPMTTIAGYADGILDGVISPEEERQYLSVISAESRRLSRLVRRMLDVSQLQAVDLIRQKHTFDLSESMRRVLVSMELKITKRGLDVDVDIPEQSVMVLGDNDLLTQVIYNLLENAVKFALPGSTLYLGLSCQGEKAVVTVRNQGETIPQEELPLLFERFHKSDKSRSVDKDGVGLGLYIVKTILEQHREKITVTSVDQVTTFSFTVQLAEGELGIKRE